MNKRKKLSNPISISKPVSPVNSLGSIQDKFTRLKAIRVELAAAKALYQEHDSLMQELMPLFIETQGDKFIVHREITIGTQKYRLTPHFWDSKKGIVAKQWKGTCIETMSIE